MKMKEMQVHPRYRYPTSDIHASTSLKQYSNRKPNINRSSVRTRTRRSLDRRLIDNDLRAWMVIGLAQDLSNRKEKCLPIPMQNKCHLSRPYSRAILIQWLIQVL